MQYGIHYDILSWYNWNIVESGVKYHNQKPWFLLEAAFFFFFFKLGLFFKDINLPFFIISTLRLYACTYTCIALLVHVDT